MAITAGALVKVAVSQIGTVESPAGSNKVKYNTWFYGREVSGSSYPWCMTFVEWCFNEAGAPMPIKTASCTALMTYAKAKGLWVTSGYKAGDIILYSFDGGADADHVGICESATNSTVTCIEGNTSLTSQDNGGKVMRRTRNIYLVQGAYRPQYATNTTTSTTTTNTTTGGYCAVTLNVLKYGSAGNAVKSLQLILNGNNYWCGTADGDFGSNTLAAVKKFQKAKGLTVDGVVGANTWSKLLK